MFINSPLPTTYPLKLYCRYMYEYTRPYMINRIWILKQLWLQVNGHAWFHLHGLRWPVRNGEGAKKFKMKIYDRIPLETYIFILKFSLPPRSEQVNGAVANEIKHVHSPEVIVVLDPRYD